MRVKCIYNFPLLPKAYSAITLYPFILFTDNKHNVTNSIYKHEMIHVRQIRAYGFFSFYISYLLYYFAGLLKFKNHHMAYIYVPYEMQAKDADNQPLTEKEMFELKLINTASHELW